MVKKLGRAIGPPPPGPPPYDRRSRGPSDYARSAAERSVDGNRIRNFNADELVAFARAFELPVTWFFLPPPPWASPGVPAKLRTPDAERFGLPLALLADLVFGDEMHVATMTLRLQAFLDELGPNPLSDAQHRITEAVEARKALLVRDALGDLQHWQTQLRALANHLEDLEHRSATEGARVAGGQA